MSGENVVWFIMGAITAGYFTWALMASPRSCLTCGKYLHNCKREVAHGD